mmetsp:Transcript_69785/g.157706  ORF Transcript_69785/g.157706 Transcript_69785/m.157706 type:complete len:216 (-) Transcript_69785:113-760(-)
MDRCHATPKPLMTLAGSDASSSRPRFQRAAVSGSLKCTMATSSGFLVSGESCVAKEMVMLESWCCCANDALPSSASPPPLPPPAEPPPLSRPPPPLQASSSGRKRLVRTSTSKETAPSQTRCLSRESSAGSCTPSPAPPGPSAELLWTWARREARFEVTVRPDLRSHFSKVSSRGSTPGAYRDRGFELPQVWPCRALSARTSPRYSSNRPSTLAR